MARNPTKGDGAAATMRLSGHAECVALTGLALHLAERHGLGRSPRRLRPGETLYRAGDRTDHLYLVHRGVVQESLASASGRELRLYEAGAGETVGELCFCDVRQRQETVVATTEAEVVPVYAEDVVRYVTSGRQAALEVLEYLFHRIGALTERIEELAFANVRERLIRRLLDVASDVASLAAGPGGRADNDRSVTLPPLTHEEWAARVYATREQVSAILADLRRRGAIAYTGRRSALTVFPSRLAALLEHE
jgi:CRP-like cAMP-binding protein